MGGNRAQLLHAHGHQKLLLGMLFLLLPLKPGSKYSTCTCYPQKMLISNTEYTLYIGGINRLGVPIFEIIMICDDIYVSFTITCQDNHINYVLLPAKSEHS